MEDETNPLQQFTTLSVIGKGTYAKVLLVRKKDSKSVYALKSMKKKYIQKRGEEGKILT